MNISRRTSFVAVALAVLSTGCFQTLDIRRPLTPQVVPKPEVLANYFGSGFDVEAMKKSLANTRSAIDYFDVNKYNETDSFVATHRLADAIVLVSRNPYAWIQLGAALALDHQSPAAIRANEKGLEIVDSLCAENCPNELENLRAVGGVNLALVLASEGRAFEASKALERVSPRALPGVDKLGFYWTSTFVRLQLGDVAGATEALIDAKAVPAEYRVGRLHYNGKVRRANESFLDALICAQSDEISCANAAIDKALEIFPQHWEARILRANLSLQQCDFKGAIETLETVSDAPKSMIFHAERVRFNLGTALAARANDPSDPTRKESDRSDALEAFTKADEIVRKRAEKAVRRLDYAGVMDIDAVSQFFMESLSEVPPVYSDALNSLADVEFESAATPEQRRVAEYHWRESLRDLNWSRRQLAWTNLTRFYCATEQPHDAIEAAHKSLLEDPYNIAPLEALAALAARTHDETLSVRLSEGIARLIWLRHERYDYGTFDDLLRPIASRLRARPLTDASGRALVVIDLVLQDSEPREILRHARMRFPAWTWLAVQDDLLEERSTDSNPTSAQRLLEEPDNPNDWWQRYERADAYILRALQAYQGQDDQSARADLERAIALGADVGEWRPLSETVNANLKQYDRPATKRIAIGPFVPIYDKGGDKTPQNLSASVDSALDSHGVDAHLADPAMPDYALLSPAEIGRRVGAGVVLSGQLATTPKNILVRVSVTDVVTGWKRDLEPIRVPIEQAHLLPARIAQDVAKDLRIPGAR